MLLAIISYILLALRPASAGCWVGGFNASLCCDETTYGPGGNSACWDDLYQFDPCCTDATLANENSSSGFSDDDGLPFDGEALTKALGPKLRQVLSEVDGDSLEADLRLTLRSPEKRTMFARDTKAYLAVLLHLRNRTEESKVMLQELASEEEVEVGSSGFWVGQNAEGYHMHDVPFSQELARFFWNEASSEAKADPQGCNGRWPDCGPPDASLIDYSPPSVVDFGCGLGLYVRDLRLAGFRSGGFDGNPATSALSEGRCLPADLSLDSLDLGTTWDWVLSLEVVEHIPDEREDAFLRNLDRHNRKGIVISWGNQPGHGHVNIRDSFYVESRMAEMGYIVDLEASYLMRQAASLAWLQQTLLVFRRQEPPEQTSS